MLRCLHIYRQLGIIWSEWGVTFKCECWCWCHRVKVVELDNCKLCAYLLPFSQRVRCSVMFISNPPGLIWRKFLALLSGEVARFLHPTWGGNASCLELIGLVGREGAESRRKYEKTNYIEKYQICHLLIHNLPGAWLRAERNYYLLMVMAWWFEEQ